MYRPINRQGLAPIEKFEKICEFCEGCGLFHGKVCKFCNGHGLLANDRYADKLVAYTPNDEQSKAMQKVGTA